MATQNSFDDPSSSTTQPPLSSSSAIVNLLQVLVTPQCYHVLFVDFDFFDSHCLRVVVSKALGYAIILGSVLVKAPQIMKMLSARSSEGISFWGVNLELAAVTSGLCYGIRYAYPFSSYGDNLFVTIQTVYIAFLTLYYDNKKGKAVFFILIFCGCLLLGLWEKTPDHVITLWQSANIPFVTVGKGIQIFYNYRNASTGQLSLITFLLSFLGCVARIFTSIQETGDRLVVALFVLASLLNGIIVAQIYYYWDSKAPTKKKQT